MIVIPAVDVLDHKVVQLVGGMPGSQQVVLEDPFEVAMDWVAKGAPYLHLVDLDAAFGKEDNSDVFCRIIREAGVPVEVGGGIRTEEQIAKYVKAGAERIVVGTKAVTDTEWLKEMANKFPDKIVVGMDMKDGKVVIKGWQEPCPYSLKYLFDVIGSLPVAGVLFTHVDVEGKKGGVDENATRQFVTDCPVMVIASGGLTTYKDAETLSRSGAIAAVVGMALYDGVIKPWEWEIPWVADLA
jgi:phosphoribosylformimino-5-aminoimidazole carboxamide ribotide isomerase